MIKTKVYYDSKANLLGTYRPCVPANSAEQFWPLAPTARIAKTASYTVKEDYRAIIAKQGNATTNRDVEIYDHKVESAFNLRFQGTNVPTGTPSEGLLRGLPWHFSMGTLNPNQEHIAFDVANADALASPKIYQKIRQASNASSGGVIIGELAETLAMLRSPFHSLRDGVRRYYDVVEYRCLKAKIRGINQKSKTRVLNDIVASTWLETSFGWRPFFNDITDILYTLQALESHPVITQVSSKAEYIVADKPKDSVILMNDIYLRYAERKQTSYTTYVKVGLLPEVDGISFSDRAISMFGLDKQDFIPTIYNLIPYSWLVDYFSNIGSLIEAACVVTDRISYASVSKVMETNDTLIINYNGTYNPGLYRFKFLEDGYRQGKYVWTRKTIARRDTIPPLSIGYKLPSLKQKLNVGALVASADRTSYKLRGL